VTSNGHATGSTNGNGVRGSRWSYQNLGENPTKGHVVVWVQVHQDRTGYFIAKVSPFPVSGFGGSVDEAMQDALGATTLYLDMVDLEGQREVVFREHNVEFYTEASEPHAVTNPLSLGEVGSLQRLSELACN